MVSSIERDHFSVFCRLNLKREKKGTHMNDKYAHSIKQEENKINHHQRSDLEGSDFIWLFLPQNEI